MFRRVCALLALLFAIASPSTFGAAPAESAGLAERARMLLDYQSFIRADRDGGVRFSLSASRDLQGTPLAELAVRLALFYDAAGLSNVNVGEAEVRRILSSETDLSPEHRDVLRRFVARSFAAAGRRDDAMEVHQRRGLAMSWLLAGPFTGREGAGFETREIPEGGETYTGDVLASLPDVEQFRQWRRNPPWRPIPANRSFPFVRPWKGTGSADDGAMLMYSVVEMEDADNKSSFHIFSDSSWRLYVDGAMVAEVDATSREVPLEHMVQYPLSPGPHRVVLHLFPPPLGVDRTEMRVAVRLESESPFTWDSSLQPPVNEQAASARREARPLRYLADLRRMADDSADLMAAYAVGCLEQRMYDVASWWAEKAARLRPDDATLLLLAGTATSMNPLLPPARRRDIASDWHRKALAVRPDLVPSLLYLAENAAEAGHARDAAAYLDRAYEVNPLSLDVLLARGQWAERFASGATRRAAWDECGRAFPESPAVQIAIASRPREGFLDMDRRLEACRTAMAAGPYIPEASLRLAEALADSGNASEAATVLENARELFAGEVGVLAEVAEVYARIGQYGEAVEVLSDAVRITPDNDALWRRLGDIHMEMDEPEAAERYWRVSLAANPGQFQLSDMMEYIDGSPARLYNEGGHDAIVMTAESQGGAYAGDVVRLLDRAVITYVGDGSYRRLTHEVDLAQTRRGGESLTGIDPRGELLTARIVFPNGNTLEPEPFPGMGGLRLPVIMPGASREVRILESVPHRIGGNTIPPWFFQDPNGQMPLALSEYVVRTPRNFPLVYVVRNLGNDVRFQFDREDGMDVYRWTAELSLPSREPDAVHISERVPSVELGVKTTWDEVVFTELRRLDGLLVPSMRMRSLLSTLYPSSPDGRPNPLVAARAIYRYVCDTIDPQPAGASASHIHMDRMGDRTVLLLSLLRAAGLDANPAAARPANDYLHPPSWELPSVNIFTVPMVRLAIPGGATYWLDTRFNSLPFGKVTDDLSGATVLSFMPTGPVFETLPTLPASDSIVYKERSIKLPGGDEPVEVSGRSLRRGVNGLLREEELAGADTETRKSLLLKSLYPVFPDAVLRQFDVQQTDDSEASSLERFEIYSTSVLEPRPDGLRAIGLCFLPPQVISEETRTFTRRTTACHIKTLHVAEDRNVFRLPEGGVFTRIPEPAYLPSRFGVYQLRVARRGEDAVELIRNYTIPAQRVMPWDWEDFLAFLERVDLAEKQWLEYAVKAEPAAVPVASE